MTEREFVSVHTDPGCPGVGTILLSRPPTNALTRQACRELSSAADEVAARTDIASVILFGGMGLWALAEMALINHAGPWVQPAAGRGVRGDLMNLAGTVVLYGLIAGIHIWLGHNPFLGTYG